MSQDPHVRLGPSLQQWFPEFGYRSQDDLFFHSLEEEFSGLSLLAQLKTFHAWCLDQPRHKTLHYRLAFRKWLTRAQTPGRF